MSDNFGFTPPHEYSPEEAIERAKILTADGAPGFDKAWALAIMRGLLTAIATRPEERFTRARELLELAGGALIGVATGLEQEAGQGGELIDKMRGLATEIGQFLSSHPPQEDR